jgi:hypothetical protein
MQGKENVVADALSQGYVLLNTLNTKLLGFEYIKELYLDDNNFGSIYDSAKFRPMIGFLGMMDFCLRKINCLCLIVLCMNCL